MSLLDRIFPRQSKLRQADSTFRTMTAYSPAWTTWRGCIYESELVRSAIHARASHVSKMSVTLTGSANAMLASRLRVAPNDWQTWSQMLYRLSTILDTETTAYILPTVDEYDRTTGIIPILPSRTEFVEHGGTVYARFAFASGQTAAIEASRIGIVSKYQYRNDLGGDGNDALQRTMDLISLQAQGIQEAVKSSATYRFMARVTNFSFAEDLAKERKEFSRLNFGDNADGGGLLLFPSTYGDIQQIKAQNWTVDAEQMRLINNNVYNYFGVNEAILQSKATADELDAFYSGSLEPLQIQLSEVLTRMLFSPREQAAGNGVLITSDRLQYMSVTSKVNVIQTMGDRGMLTINEARQLLNYPPVPDGDKLMPIRGEYYNAVDPDPDPEPDPQQTDDEEDDPDA